MRAHARKAAAVVALVTLPAPCLAQGVVAGPPKVTWFGPGRPADTSGHAGRRDRIGELAIEPLRLSLLGAYPWTPLDAMSGCRDQLADTRSGSAASGFMKTYATNLLGGPGAPWSMPRLTLFGFSRGGCTLDGAAGGGASFIVPIRHDVFFVAGAGAIYLPAAGTTATPATSTSIRADVVFRRPDGKSLSIGIGNTRGLSGVQLGGMF